jgi:DnaJ-class molecular chaperone
MQMTGSTDGTSPGDEAAPGTPGTGENLCRACNGSGEKEGERCPVCDGSGKVIEGIGGG